MHEMQTVLFLRGVVNMLKPPCEIVIKVLYMKLCEKGLGVSTCSQSWHF